MRLFGTKTSPYTRKVRVVAAELGLDLDFTEVVFSDPPADFAAANPLRKAPTLMADDRTAIYDSPVIAEWLCAEHGGGALLPPSGARRWAILKTQALADGLLDAAVSVRYESQRPPAQQSADWIEKQLGKVRRALEVLEADGAWRALDAVDLGQIAVASALGYLALRMPDLLDRSLYPSLLDWQDRFAQRPSMAATAPA